MLAAILYHYVYLNGAGTLSLYGLNLLHASDVVTICD